MRKNPVPRNALWVAAVLSICVAIFAGSRIRSKKDYAVPHAGDGGKFESTPLRPTQRVGDSPRAAENPKPVVSPEKSEADRAMAASPNGTRTIDQSLPDQTKLPSDFLDRIVSGKTVLFTLPDGSQAKGEVQMIQRDHQGVLFVQGRLSTPHPGFYFFQRQTIAGLAGPLVGNVRFDGKTEAWKIESDATLTAARMVPRKLDEILCANYEKMPEATGGTAGDVEEAPQTHPYPVPIPSYQTIVPLQSLPGATAVIYLDFDGEQGPFPGWGDFNAAPATANNSQVFDVWKMVCEDYQGFNLNVTTDRKVFDNTPEGRRVHCIITPTTTAAPGAGGVAYVGSFNWSGDRVCWAFYSTGKASCEVIAHEVGHTLGLSHDGRTSPSEGYYGGHGSDPVGWAPIMGVGYYKKLSQWSKGEYLSANQTQDDLSIIVNNNNDVDYRADDTGDVQSVAKYLEIYADNSVTNEGIIEKTGDVDSYRFATAGGLATINVNTVTLNPNLDVLAEIVDVASSTVVATANPDTGINATVSATLTAGEYLLRIRGTGRGDPLGDGYTNYGCLGSYLITGSVVGGVKSERFSIAENSSIGTSVGTVAPRNIHAGATLSYSISGGNSGTAFSINPVTGALSVANSSVLDFETLSLRWDDPATIELFVSISDPLNPALNENLRTVVSVTDNNELPTITGGSQTLLEHSIVGTKVFKVTGSDSDHFDFPHFSITAGNTGGIFAIDSGTGQITVATNIDVSANTVYNLTVQTADQGSPALSATANVAITVVNIADGYQPGRIVRTYFENITGGSVANLTGNAKFPNTPDSEQFLTSFDGVEHGDNFGSTIRGYLIPPSTGSYQFWIASDDASELRLSTNASPASATVKATVAGYTNPYAWTANASQQSSTINLTAGQPYYIEARHKEGGGGDHLAVAWSGPDFTRQVISGLYLVPFYQNYAPKVNAATFSVRENAIPAQSIGTVTSSDVNAQDSFSGYTITAGNTGGVFGITPATGQLFVASANLLNATTTPSFTLTVRSTDNGTPALNGTGTITINVVAASTINGSGIVQEIWTGLSGSSLSTLTGNSNYPYKANTRRTLNLFDSGGDYADNYGSRIRARFIPPTTGDYRFYLAGDDDSRLLFSSNPNGTGATQIANFTGWTDHNVWTKFSTQTSAVISLSAGQAVYLETLQKEAGGGDHVSVGYTSPDVTTVTVIPGSLLQPFDINAAPVFSPASYSYNVNAATATAGMTVGSVTATEPNGEPLVYAILSGNTVGAFAINSSTGTLTVTNPSLLSNGVTTLQIATQDGGLGGLYPLDSATATATITVTGNNTPPSFTTNPITKPDATEAVAYNQTLAGLATDPNPGDSLTYSKTSGPAWLGVAANGALTGTPGNFDPGANTFVVRATDTAGAYAEVTLNINVVGVNFAPAFAADPINAGALLGTAYSGLLSASDPDSGDTITFSKVTGPSWLTVSTNGLMSGTPAAGDAGNNVFTVRVTDNWGLHDDATLNVLVLTTPTWGNASGGSWPTSSNWQGGIIANGADRTASFAALDLTANTTVTLDAARSIGHLNFSDSTPSHDWTLNAGTSGTLTLDVSSGSPTITVQNQSAILGTVIAGTKGLTKLGAGTMVLTAANTYTGSTIVSAGTLLVNGSSGNGVVTVGASATLGGTGTMGGTVSCGGTLSPGSDSVGALTANGQLTLQTNSSVIWEIGDWNGSEGSGYDKLTANGLSVNSTSGSPTTIQIRQKDLINFSETSRTFTLVANTGTLADFSAQKFVLDASGFTAGAGTWAVQSSGNDLILTYTRSNTPPAFTTHPNTLSAMEGQAFSSTVSANDGDSSEHLIYTKLNGPAWLSVASNGALSGTPANADVGTNLFTIKVQDSFNASDTLSLSINVLINDTDANSNGILDTWEIAKFGNADPGAHPPGDDPDGDGLGNLLEFAFDTHPLQANPSPLAHDLEPVGIEKHLRLTILKNPAATNLTYTVETCGSLNDWSAATTLVETDSPSQLIVRDSVAVSSSAHRFIRLKVTAAP